MKKAAAAAVLLSLMLGMAFWNMRYLDTAIGDMTAHVEQCRSQCREGEMKAAEEELDAAAGIWGKIHVYAHIFLRQTETDTVENAIRDARECLRTDDTQAAEVALDWLEGRLSAMAAMEHVTLESVF